MKKELCKRRIRDIIALLDGSINNFNTHPPESICEMLITAREIAIQVKHGIDTLEEVVLVGALKVQGTITGRIMDPVKDTFDNIDGLEEF